MCVCAALIRHTTLNLNPLRITYLQGGSRHGGKITWNEVRAVFNRLFAHRPYRFGMMTQFCYVGAQIMCWTFIIHYGKVELDMVLEHIICTCGMCVELVPVRVSASPIFYLFILLVVWFYLRMYVFCRSWSDVCCCFFTDGQWGSVSKHCSHVFVLSQSLCIHIRLNRLPNACSSVAILLRSRLRRSSCKQPSTFHFAYSIFVNAMIARIQIYQSNLRREPVNEWLYLVTWLDGLGLPGAGFC